MATRKSARNLSLSAEAEGFLEAVGSGNVSAYIERVLELRWRAWHEGLALLVAAGWKAAELHCACDALNGCWMLGTYRSPGSVALELHDAQRLTDVCSKHGAVPDRYAELVQALAQDWQLAFALLDVVEEWWAGNGACEEAVRRAGAEAVS